MRALLLADLHLDLWLPESVAHPLDLIDPEVLEALDLVVVAGDLVNKGEERWRRALIWLGERVDIARVHVFPGNHDFYSGDLDREDKLQAAAEEAGAHWAQKAEVVLGRRRFLCCTLWTDMAVGGNREANAVVAESMMNDYRVIRVASDGYRRARAADTVAIHLDHRRWLEARLAEPFDGETVVVTHHAPLPVCNGAEFGSSPVAAAYVSDLSGLIECHRPALWAYGHTHVPIDFASGATRVLNVSIGYPPRVDPRPAGEAAVGLLEWPA